MKILIVDDEELTRAGLRASIDWQRFGIREVLQADDGIKGVEMAKKHKPDIILCDVRMPRMDGIHMLEEIESFLPNISAIFMSGFSDKEYLKAAIKLKAISYIEKPIDPVEICEALEQACQGHISSSESAALINKERLLDQFAYCLTVPYKTAEDTINTLLADSSLGIKARDFQYAFSIIIRMETAGDEAPDLRSVYAALSTYIKSMHLSLIVSEKRLGHSVIHIYGSLHPSCSSIIMITEKLSALISPICRHYIAIGQVENGIDSIYNSYSSAVIALQNSFFTPCGTILYPDTAAALHPSDTLFIESTAAKYNTALSEGINQDVSDALLALKSHLSESCGILTNQLKGIYYDMFSTLYKLKKKQQADLLTSDTSENIMDIMDSCFSFADLHEKLTKQTINYMQDSKGAYNENSTIALIKDYIAAHFAESDLSVKNISDYANMSASYTCTFFKSETGTTLNQYILEYRMKKAKQLLADPRNKISDISFAVGYNDGNYFAKSFRKHTGVSPSEYREQVIKS